MARLKRAKATVLAMLLWLCLPRKSPALQQSPSPAHTQSEHFDDLEYIRFAFFEDSSPGCCKGDSTEGSSWPSCLHLTCHHYHLSCFPSAMRTAASYCSADTKAQRKSIHLSGRAQLRETPVLPSLHQKVENIVTYLFFIYVHENMSNFSLYQIK